MLWTTRVTKPAGKQLRKLPVPIRNRIMDFLKTLEGPENSQLRARKLVGVESRWRYRVGDYRIICEIRDRELLVLVIDIGHRRDIYT